jgi:hypothetical protein
MLTYKLVHLIEYHADNLAASLSRRVRMSERAGSYRNVSPIELEDAVCEIYRHLGTWLMSKKNSDIEERYNAVGARRAQQNVPLSELLWVIVLTKYNLQEFIGDVTFPGRAVDADEKQELSLLLDQFFDQAMYAAAVGYESGAVAGLKAGGTKKKKKTRNAVLV